MICLDNVTFSYSQHGPVFRRFSWQVARGEIWTVVGPSGSGKSTLLLLLAGLVRAQQGTLTVEGRDLSRPRPQTGLILQEYGLLPWASLRENVSLGLRIRRFYGPDGRHAPAIGDAGRAATDARVEHWLNRLNIADVAARSPGQVSGGQRQRAAIARALVLQPDLLLMDEPFSALDAPTRESMQALTLALSVEAKLTVVLVTHSIEEAAFVGQNVLLLSEMPNIEAKTAANPHTPDAAYRASGTFRSTCAALRQVL